ncbi:MAG TPA: 4Fe-4S single cluster domain-containing protein [Blastocatellia bacterium]|nr:4Fe-4S single cluster domain-containing protein [Blastocatellia bacterium]
MKETTWIIDPHTGALTIEGLNQPELKTLATDLLPAGKQVNCARPIDIRLFSDSPILIKPNEPSLRVFRIYHGSVVEGPGRRSVAQLSGCDRRCVGCFAVETWPLDSGVELGVGEVVERLLDPIGEPRDGVTVLGGEPFLQPVGLLSFVTALKAHGQHVTLYSGYTLEELLSRSDTVIDQILGLADVLIDGPFVKELSGAAGEWRGSTNQRIIYK